MPRQITAYSNPLIKSARDLRDKRHRREQGRFMAEGLRILTEAREAGRVPTLVFFAAASAGHPLVRTLVDAVEAAGGEAIETTPDILSKLSGKDNPQNVVGVFDEFATTLDQLDRGTAGIWLVAEVWPGCRGPYDDAAHYPSKRPLVCRADQKIVWQVTIGI